MFRRNCVYNICQEFVYYIINLSPWIFFLIGLYMLVHLERFIVLLEGNIKSTGIVIF